tara:strand:+ start:1183 stop:1602 length:420 start_codon:yes stop_codon:yes gene_type:complete
MANNPPISNTQSLAQTVVMSGAGGQSNPSMDALIQLLTRKLSAEQDAEDLATSQAKAAQKANADSLMQAQKVLEAQQANCTHTKPGTNRTALAGQKTHRNFAVFVCQYCAKPFSEPPQRPIEKIPQHLFPDMSLVGGPH